MNALANAAERPTSAISIEHLTKRYGSVEALSDFSLEVPEGSLFGFLGPNGAGKTTAIKILTGLAKPTAGSATVAGVRVTAEGNHRRRIGYLAQEPRFYDWMTGRQTLRFVASFYAGDADELERRIDDLLDQAGILDAGDRKTKTYSGGMRQRLGIAQALVGRPAVLMLDEPASSLDPIGRKDVLDLLARLRGETTVLFSTHILDDVERVTDHVAIMDHGRLIVSADTRELLASFAGGILRVVLGGANDDTAGDLAALPGVATVTAAARDGDTRSYDVTTKPDQQPIVQRAIGTLAVTAGMTLISAAEASVDLEQVFLRLVGPKEQPA
jgi:ABC-2 type transport system ATP-binding protein